MVHEHYKIDCYLQPKGYLTLEKGKYGIKTFIYAVVYYDDTEKEYSITLSTKNKDMIHKGGPIISNCNLNIAKDNFLEALNLYFGIILLMSFKNYKN